MFHTISPQETNQVLINPERLRARRHELGYTQAEVASACGISLRQYQRYESSESHPSVKGLLGASRKLNVTSEWLLGFVEKENQVLHVSELRPDQLEVLAAYEAGDVQAFARLVRKKWGK